MTGCSDTIAKKVLQENSWYVDRAINYYYDNQHKYGPTVDSKKLAKIFDKYAGSKGSEEEDEFSEEGFDQFITDLGYSGDEVFPFFLSWILNSEEMGLITRKAFTETFEKKHPADTFAAIKKIIVDKTKSLNTCGSKDFKECYRYVFTLYKEADRKTLDTQDAITIWNLLLTPARTPNNWKIKDFADFVDSEEQKNLRTIKHDVWICLFDFFSENKPDLSDYEDDGCWPTVIDEFVEYLQKKK